MKLKKVLAAFLAGTVFLTGLSVYGGSTVKADVEETAQDAVYSADEAYVIGDYMTFTVYAVSSGEYQVDFNSDSETAETVDITINGIPSGSVQIPSEGNKLKLNKGINTIRFKYTDAVKELKLYGSKPLEETGVTAAYTTYEAETCTTDGTILEDSRVYREIQSEASGRSAVKLENPGQSIKFKLLEDANAITLRYCVPDSADGAGEAYTLNFNIGGDSVDATVTSYHTWVYGAYPYTNTPDDKPHNFFDDVTFKLDKTYPAGTEITISKTADNTAEYYIVDFIETELFEEAHTQPENSLSITEYGAVANDGEDDTQALLDCVTAAVADGKEVWIPAGEFTFTQGRINIAKDNVTIRGAGMWHTVLTGPGAAFYIKADNTAFYDFKMQGDVRIRQDAVDPAAFELANSTYSRENLTIQNIWVEHYKVGAWTYNVSGVHMVGCRIRNTFADGINLCKASSNSMVEQSNFRGTGDDAVAMWSQTYSDVNNIVRYNTIALPDLANGVAIYGGKDIKILNNMVSDIITEGSGINISTNFQPADFGERIIVEGNILNRCGSQNDTSGSKMGAIWFNTVFEYDNNAEVIVRNNIVRDSSYQGISFGGVGTVKSVWIDGNTLENSGTWAIECISSAHGSAVIQNNTITGSGEGEVNNNGAKNFTFAGEGFKIENASAMEGETSTEENADDNKAESDSTAIVIAVVVFVVIIIVGLIIVTVIFNKKKKHVNAQQQ